MTLKMPDRYSIGGIFIWGMGDKMRLCLAAIVVSLIPFLAGAATCDAGYFLLNGECTICRIGYYCPGDDTAHDCVDVAVEMDNAVAWGPDRATINARYHYSLTGFINASECQCEWYLYDDTRTLYYQYGACMAGPSGTTYNYHTACRVGYYAIGPTGENNWYTGCAPCDNGPANSVYTSNSIPSEMYAVESNCMWKCADGYSLTANNTCEQLCGAGFTQIKTDTGLSIPIYAARQTTPAINIGVGDNVCYAELLLGRAGGAINISYDNKVYHTYSQNLSSITCPAGYWLSDGLCTNCGRGYYCTGDNTRKSCRDLVPVDSLGNLSSVVSLSDGSWASFENAVKSRDCVCDWLYSDETRVQYQYESRCEDGPTGYQYTKYNWCRVGHYAIKPLYSNNWYSDCAPCDNGPANSHYTSYSTPSVIYAVESNCPWECDAGYVLVNGGCVAQ